MHGAPALVVTTPLRRSGASSTPALTLYSDAWKCPKEPAPCTMQQRGGSCDANLMQDANPWWFSCSSCRLSVNVAPPNFTMAAQVGAVDAMYHSSRAMLRRYSDMFGSAVQDLKTMTMGGGCSARPNSSGNFYFLPTFGIPQTYTLLQKLSKRV